MAAAALHRYLIQSCDSYRLFFTVSLDITLEKVVQKSADDCSQFKFKSQQQPQAEAQPDHLLSSKRLRRICPRGSRSPRQLPAATKRHKKHKCRERRLDT